MTPAEHAELSAQVARAIGWKYVATDINPPVYHVYVSNDAGECGWFDYRNPSVALPLLEWLMREHGCHPMPLGSNFYIVGCAGNVITETATLHEAIARAVIAVKEQA